jgi:hypothetical protein
VLARLHRIPDALERLLADRRRVAAWAGGILLVCLWIAWTIHVGTSNGWNAAVGVLITWPLLACIGGLVAMAVVGSRRILDRRRAAAVPSIAGAGPPPKLPKGHDSVTTLTFPS